MGGASVSYAKESGLREDKIGFLASAANVLGFVAAISYPMLVGSIGVASTALAGIGVNLYCINYYACHLNNSL